MEEKRDSFGHNIVPPKKFVPPNFEGPLTLEEHAEGIDEAFGNLITKINTDPNPKRYTLKISVDDKKQNIEVKDKTTGEIVFLSDWGIHIKSLANLYPHLVEKNK